MPLTDRLGAIRSPPYRRFLAGWTLSSLSTWVYYTAVSWALLESDGATAAVGLLPIVLGLPVPFAMLASGVLTDRRGPRHVLLLSQAAMVGVIGLAALLSALGLFGFWANLGIGVLVGVVAGLVNVPCSALIVRLVDQHETAEAYGSSLLTVGVGRILGGPLGGALVALAGATPAFIVATIGMALAAVLYNGLPRSEGLTPTESIRSPLLDLRRALAWISRARAALAMIAIGAIVSAVLLPYIAVLPVIARDLVGGSAQDLGLLIAAGGIGVLAGAVGLPVLARHIGHGKLLVLTVVTAAIGIAGLGVSQSFVVSAGLLALVAASTNGFGTAEGLLMQTMSPAAIRGRVLAIDGVVFNVANPVGTLAVGLLIDPIGARTVLFGMAAVSLVGILALLAVRRPVVELEVDEAGELVDARRAVRAEEPAP